jgi:uncharacterized integral membrane protein
MMVFVRFLRIVFFGQILVTVLGFSSHSTTKIAVWLGHEFTAQPVSLWIISAFISGGLAGLLMGQGIWRRLQYRHEIHKLQ